MSHMLRPDRATSAAVAIFVTRHTALNSSTVSSTSWGRAAEHALGRLRDAKSPKRYLRRSSGIAPGRKEVWVGCMCRGREGGCPRNVLWMSTLFCYLDETIGLADSQTITTYFPAYRAVGPCASTELVPG